MSSYQITLFIGTSITIFFIVISVIKTKMNIRYAIIWILWGIIMLILSVYPGIIDKLSVILGIAVPVNTVFLIFIFLLYAISFYLFTKVSNLSNEIKNLTYKLSVLEKIIEEKMTKKMLVIPGGFVPYNDTVTLLSYKHLRSLDAKMDVIALKGKEDEGLSKSLKEDGNFKKINIEYFGNYDDTVATYERKNVITSFFNLIKYCFYSKRKAKENKYDVVYTSSIPSFTHLAGYLIKKMLKDDIVWIASFSDPLYKSPYKKDLESFKEYNMLQKIGFFVYIWIYMNGMDEKIAQKYADKVLYICKEQKDFMISHYPNKEELNKKAMVIPLNYIKDWTIYKDLLVQNKTKNKKKIISHFGRIYGLRKIDSVLMAIKELKEEIPNLSEKLVFEQYGQILDRYVNMIDELKIGDIFKCYDKISYNEVMDKMHKSDALALYDTFVKEDEMQPYLPSKSLEYLLLKKDLLILAQKNSPTFRIFKCYGYKCTENNVESIKERIKEILNSDNGYMNYDISSLENEVATKPLQDYINSI